MLGTTCAKSGHWHSAWKQTFRSTTTRRLDDSANGMQTLFDPSRHEALVPLAWDEGAARTAIEEVAAEARRVFTAEGLWPLHPADTEDGEIEPHTSLYFGAAGVIWTLDHLASEGAIPAGPTFSEHLLAIGERNRAVLQSEAWRRVLGAGWQTRSWLFGDAGILFTSHKTAPDAATMSELAKVIEENTQDLSRELMWGAAGTMLPALTLYRASGEARWRDLYLASAERLSATFTPSTPSGIRCWTQSIYGSQTQYLGPVHGFAGNAWSLLAGRDLLTESLWRPIASRVAETLRATSVRNADGNVNWPAFIGQPADRPLLVQHCHGAPGMVTALGGLDEPIDDLLLGAGHLTWLAGPLHKGSALCHGTAGNGFAFLRLFERTGDEAWLTRARLFAMHALEQSEAEATRLGRRRYSLWTGDLGLACFLWECVRGSARFPTVDHL